MKLISALSFFLVACAGTPPKMERPIKIYNGVPESREICRLSRSAVSNFAQKTLREDLSKQEMRKNIASFISQGGADCIDTTDREFAKYAALKFDDLKVLIRYQEKLIFSCEQWKNQE